MRPGGLVGLVVGSPEGGCGDCPQGGCECVSGDALRVSAVAGTLRV